jgi:quercetin dioxygenase-like cupin family protein
MTSKDQVPTLIRLNEERPSEIPEEGIFSKTLMKTPYCTQTLMQFGSGEELTEHTSKFAALLEFKEGAGTVTLGDQEYDIESGLTVYMPPKLPHAITTTAPTEMVLTLLKNSD